MTDQTETHSDFLGMTLSEILETLKQQSPAQLTSRQQEKKNRERAKMQSRREQRATYDLHPAIRAAIKQLAEEQSLPTSQLVNLALGRFLQQYSKGEIDLNKFKRSSRSPRYDWNLSLPTDLIPAMPRKRKSPKTAESGSVK